MPSDTTVYAGRYSDGKTASSVPADVRLTDRGVEIGFPGAPQALVWPYGALGVATPLTSKSADALVSYSFMPGASLFVADPAFVKAVAKAAPQLTAAAYGWRAVRPLLLAAVGVAIVGIGVWAAGLSPARTLAGLMPHDVRRTIGEQVINSMSDGRRECTVPAGRAALDKLVSRLAAGAKGRDGAKVAEFKVKVLDWRLLNAFAVPGEQIVLTRQIITEAKSPDEVAGVLAHEMGHGLELHPETAIVRIVGVTAAVELMFGGGSALANLGLMLTQIGYTRAAEHEADARGLALLVQARIAPTGVAEFFRRMGAAEKKQGAPEWDILRTHPQSEERAKLAASRPPYPSTPALSDADWQALRGICGTAEPAGPASPPK